MNIVFLGPPGSGKGTQAKQLAEKKNLVHLSTGDVFREAIQGQTELGKEIKSFVDAGKLVPDELVSRVVFEKLKRMDKGFLLDGYPRTVDQARSLEDFSKKNDVSIDAVLFFDVAFPELVKRLSARRQCPKCKEVFNLAMKAPKKTNTCDNCGSELSHRADDQPAVVQDRLQVYTKQTEPVLHHYENKKGFHKIDAAQPIDKVFKDILSALEGIHGVVGNQKTQR